MLDPHPQRSRLRTDLSATAADAAEYLISVVPTGADRVSEPGDLITRARMSRIHALRLLDLAVLTEIASGTGWERVAEVLGWPPDLVRDRYRELWEAVSRGEPVSWPGLNEIRMAVTPLQPQRVTAAADLDAWYQRVAGDGASSAAVSAGLF